MAWGTHRKGRLLSVALPHNIVSELIRRKSQRGLSMTYQIVEALTSQFNDGPKAPPAVVQGPVVTRPVVQGRYASMRSQPIQDRTNFPWNV